MRGEETTGVDAEPQRHDLKVEIWRVWDENFRVRQRHDLKVEIWRVWDENFRVSGARKIWMALNREGSKSRAAPLPG